MTEYFSQHFRNYARVHGRTPEQQLEHDSARWPGGCMTGYIMWITRHLRLARPDRSEAGMKQFDAYLDKLTEP